MDAEALPGPLDIPEIREAMEALKMLGQTDMQRQIYEGRLKARRDERMRLYEATEQGLQQGLQQGRQEGVLIGRIELLQQLLQQIPLARRDLESMGLNELQRMEEELTRQLTQK